MCVLYSTQKHAVLVFFSSIAHVVRLGSIRIHRQSQSQSPSILCDSNVFVPDRFFRNSRPMISSCCSVSSPVLTWHDTTFFLEFRVFCSWVLDSRDFFSRDIWAFNSLLACIEHTVLYSFEMFRENYSFFLFIVFIICLNRSIILI